MPVYFIQAGEGGPVKIGSTADTSSRLRELQCANPVELSLLREVDGGLAEERWLQKHFSRRRLRGEWFSFCPSMLSIETPDLPPGATRAINQQALEIIDHLGGKGAAARLCDVTVGAVKKWRQNGIPGKHWPTIVKKTSGAISFERLATSYVRRELQEAA
jgi:hypothetical protein